MYFCASDREGENFCKLPNESLLYCFAFDCSICRLSLHLRMQCAPNGRSINWQRSNFLNSKEVLTMLEKLPLCHQANVCTEEK